MMRTKLINSRRFFTSRALPISAEVMVRLDMIIGGVIEPDRAARRSDENRVFPTPDLPSRVTFLIYRSRNNSMPNFKWRTLGDRRGAWQEVAFACRRG